MKYFILLFFISLCCILNAQISQDSLLAYFPFNGNTFDSGPNFYHGINTGGTFDQDEEGNLNSSLKLDGIEQYVDLNIFADVFRDNLPELTIYFKVKFDHFDSNQTLLSLGTNGENIETNVFEFEFENGQIQLETEIGNSAENIELNLELPDNIMNDVWQEVIITFKDDSLTYCRNDEVIYKGKYIPAETTVQRLFLGCFNGGGDNACCFFSGNIDELQFYNRILDKAELISSVIQIKNDNPLINTYPNPNFGKLTLEVNNGQTDFIINIIDINGRILNSQKYINKDKVEIHLPDPKGIYFIQYIDKEGKMINHRIVHQ